MHTLTVEEIQRFLVTAKGHRLEVLFTLALATGMRRSELLALQWKDVDWHNGSLHVQRAVHLFEQVSPPKTAAQRTVVLSASVLEALREHRKRQDAERSHAGTTWTERDLMFCTGSGNVLSPQHLATNFHALLMEAQLPPIRFHDLRLSVGHHLFQKEKGQG